ncbi:MAG: hypothetical protein WC314_26525 [Vulcanimicrobiota bacterium]
MQSNSIAYSVDEFSRSFQQNNQNSLGVYGTGFIIDIRSDDISLEQQSYSAVLQNGNSFEDRCEKVIEKLYEEIAPTLRKHPCYRLWQKWTQEVGSSGLQARHKKFWQSAYEQALAAVNSLDSMYLGEREWTFETAVADRLLEEGANLYLESLEELKDAPGEDGLAWLEESLFYLVAVEKWEAVRV